MNKNLSFTDGLSPSVLLGHFSNFPSSFAKFEQVWTRKDKFAEIKAILEKFGQVWTSLNKISKHFLMFESLIHLFLPRALSFK